MASSKVSPQKQRPPRKKSAVSKKKAQQRKINKYIRITGRVAFIIQALLSLIMIVTIGRTGMLPWKYIVLIFLGLVVLSAITFAMNLKRNRKIRLAGAGISIVVIIFILVFTNYFNRTIGLISGGEKALKTDNMVVVVRAEDPAKDLKDAKDYKYGVHLTSTDTGGSNAMISDIEGALSSKIKVEEYSSDIEAAKALLEGKVDAAIYNKAYTPTLDEGITEYSDKIRILYSFDLTSEAKNINERQASVEEPFTVYISGIDVEGPITTTSRSDVNILVTVNPYTHQILQTSTPRDYYVPIPGVSGEERDKLTHAGIYGINTSIETIESIYDVQVDYYVRVNFTSVINIVDALGGIDVYVEEPYGDFHHGINHMDGETALAFSRERYAFATGDNQRGRDQEAVIAAIIDKLTSREVLLHADALMEVMAANMQTSMTREDITKLVSRQLTEGIQWNNESQVATGTGDSQTTFSMGDTKLFVMWPDEDVIAGLSARIKEVLAAR